MTTTENLVVNIVELMEIRSTDTLLVAMPETWVPARIEEFVVFLNEALRKRHITVAGILPVPGLPNGALRAQVLRQEEAS